MRHAALALGCIQHTTQALDLDEDIEVVTPTVDEFVAHLRDGQQTAMDNMAWMCLDQLRPWSREELVAWSARCPSGTGTRRTPRRPDMALREAAHDKSHDRW